MAEDPFALDQLALEKKLQALQTSFVRWREVKSQAGGGGSGAGLGLMSADLVQDELQWLAGEITRALRSLAWEVGDLEKTLTAMQQQPQQFPELSGLHTDRALFLSNARAFLAAIETEVSGAAGDVAAATGSAAPETPTLLSAQPAPATSDVDLLLQETDTRDDSQLRRWPLPAWLHRHRRWLTCLALVLGAAFILWVFYEAVLSGARRVCPSENVTAAATTTPALTSAYVNTTVS